MTYRRIVFDEEQGWNVAGYMEKANISNIEEWYESNGMLAKYNGEELLVPMEILRKPDDKIAVKSIKITQLEGTVNSPLTSTTVKTFKEADAVLTQIKSGNLNEASLGYIKINVEINWDNDFLYRKRYDLELHTVCDIADHIKDTWTKYSGASHPAHTKMKDWKEQLKAQKIDIDEYRELLNTYSLKD